MADSDEKQNIVNTGGAEGVAPSIGEIERVLDASLAKQRAAAPNVGKSPRQRRSHPRFV